MIRQWHVVAIAETIRRSLVSGQNLLMMTDPGYDAVAAARRVARLLARGGADQMAWRAPHHSVNIEQLRREAALAQGGMLYLDEVDEFNRRAVRSLATTSGIVATACMPEFGDNAAKARSRWGDRVVTIAREINATIVDVRI